MNSLSNLYILACLGKNFRLLHLRVKIILNPDIFTHAPLLPPGKLLTHPRLIFQKSYSPSRKGVEETIMLGNEVGFHGMTYAGF